MKKLIIIAFLLLPVLMTGQNRRDPHDRGGSPQQQDILMREKLKAIEILGLSEDVAVKFFARRQEYNEKFWTSRQDLRKTIDELENQIKSGKKFDEAYYKKQIGRIAYLEKEPNRLRQEFFNSLRKLLTTEQIAKYYVFETRFREEIRNEMNRQREKPQK